MLRQHTYRNMVKHFQTYKSKIRFPDKLKGTVFEKWANYWKGLLTDYTEVVRDTLKDGRDNPAKTFKVLTISSLVFLSFKKNPDYLSFIDTVRYYQNEFGLVGAPIRNKESEKHLVTLEKFYNEGRLRKFSFGVLSVIWVDNYDRSLGLYKAQCDYLKPKYLTMYERVIDVGFWDRWWVLESKLKDFDVNNEEWDNFTKTEFEYSS